MITNVNYYEYTKNFLKKQIKYNMIYKEVTNIIIDTLSRFKGVQFVKYTDKDLVNQQHNYKTIQCWLDDISLHQFNLTQNTAKVEYQVYILGFPEDTPESILDVQDKCYDVALYTLAYLDNMPQFKGIVSLYDYSILTLSHYTAQNNAGVKLSVVLTIPNGTNLCELENKFGEPYKEDEDPDIDINPIHLPLNNPCCK